MQLTSTDDVSPAVDALAARHGGRVGLRGVLVDLDRRLHRAHAPCLSRHRAWTWERADRGDRDWWPQGVSAAPGGRYVLVSWYRTGGGSRVSVVDLLRRRYRHVGLVLPTPEAHEPLRVHAGGLAWDGADLYVAATRAGLWHARLDDLVRTSKGYLLPVRRRLAPDEPFRFSFVGQTDVGLVAGEYGRADQTRRLARLDPAGPCEVTDLGVVRAQGVAVAGGTYYVTASHGPWKPGSLWSGRPGAMTEHRYAVPMGPEDLAHDPTTGRLWTVTEHPHRRWLVALPTP